MKFLRVLREDWLIASVVFLVSVPYLAQFRGSLEVRGIADEGYVLDAVQKMKYGELIYQDFHVFQGPLSFFLLSVAFSVFGTTLNVARIFTAILGGCMASMTFILSRSLFSNPLVALYPPLLFIFFGFHNWNNVSHHWFSMSFFLLGLITFQRYLHTPSGRHYLFLAGVLGGMSLLSVQPDGVVFFISAFFVLILRERTRGGFAASAKEVLSLAMGAALCLCMFFAFFFFYARTFQGYTSFHALMKGYVFDTIIWPMGPYAKANALPQYFYFGNQIMAEYLHTLLSPSHVKEFLVSIFGLPLVALFGYAPFPALVFSAWSLISRRKTSTTQDHIILIFFLSCLFFLLGAIMARPDPIHLIYFSPIALVLFFTFLEKGIYLGGSSSRSATKYLCLFLFFNFGIAVPAWGLSWTYSLFTHPSFEVRIPRGTLRFPNSNLAREFSGMINFIDTHTHDGEYVYIHGYSPQYYFLLNRRNPTPYDLMIPVLFVPSQLREAVSHIEVKDPRYVLYDGKIEAFMQNPSGGTFPTLTVDDVKDNPIVTYIHSMYRPIMRFPSLGLAILEHIPSGEQPR